MRHRFIPAILAATMAGSAGNALAQAGDFALPVSVERVRRQLQRAPAVDLAEPKADFLVRIAERQRFFEVYGEYELHPPKPGWQSLFVMGERETMTGTVPLMAVDVLTPILALKNKVQRTMYHRAERKARDFVRRDLEEYCAVNGCTLPPAP